ncbi:MAG TPA: 3'-5' exonuclease, partial [bacterium]|nr:3'-5' exonuclease [bacterium]
RAGVTGRISTLVNPGVAIPYYASGIHGIYDRDVSDAPRFRDIVSHFHHFIGGRILVMHNASFDIGCIRHEMARAGHDLAVPYICTSAFPGYWGARARNALGDLCAAFDVRIRNAHTALGDAEATAALFSKFLRKCAAMDKQTFGSLAGGKSYAHQKSWHHAVPRHHGHQPDNRVLKPRFH